MRILRKKSFSGTKILNTNAPGFIKGRKYDTDLDRLGRIKTAQGELREMNKELNNGRLGKWQNM